MAKFCPNCGNEMVDEAAMCVKCGTMVEGNNTNKNNESKPTTNGEKKKGLPAWAIVLIVLGGLGLLIVIAIVVFAIIGVNALKKVDPNEIKDKLNDYIEENTDSTLYGENTESTLYGTIGDTLTDGNLNLTLTEAYTYDSIGEGYFTNTPTEGKEYLVLFFDIENISTESEYVSHYDFDGYVDDVACNDTSIFVDIEGVNNLSSNLAPGKKAQGFVAFEVNNDWNGFEIHYEEFFGDKTLVFKVSNTEGA